MISIGRLQGSVFVSRRARAFLEGNNLTMLLELPWT